MERSRAQWCRDSSMEQFLRTVFSINFIVGIRLRSVFSVRAFYTQNQQNHKQIEILLHKWAAGPICPDRYGPYLSFSSGTSQEMSLYKLGKSSQSWRTSRAKLWVDSKGFYKIFPRNSRTNMEGKDHIYLGK